MAHRKASSASPSPENKLLRIPDVEREVTAYDGFKKLFTAAECAAMTPEDYCKIFACFIAMGDIVFFDKKETPDVRE